MVAYDRTTVPALTVAELTRAHVGRRVRVDHEGPAGDWAVEGRLHAIHHDDGDTETLQTHSGTAIRTHVGPHRTTLYVGPVEFEAQGNEAVTLL
jgi:hypothetical protein